MRPPLAAWLLPTGGRSREPICRPRRHTGCCWRPSETSSRQAPTAAVPACPPARPPACAPTCLPARCREVCPLSNLLFRCPTLMQTTLPPCLQMPVLPMWPGLAAAAVAWPVSTAGEQGCLGKAAPLGALISRCALQFTLKPPVICASTAATAGVCFEQPGMPARPFQGCCCCCLLPACPAAAGLRCMLWRWAALGQWLICGHALSARCG